MAKVTSKRQVTIPKSVADRYGIQEGDELEFIPAGDVIRVTLGRATSIPRSVSERLALFDAATERQRWRQEGGTSVTGERGERGWTREDLYVRGRAG